MIKPRALKRGDTIRSSSSIRTSSKRYKRRNRKVSGTYEKTWDKSKIWKIYV